MAEDFLGKLLGNPARAKILRVFSFSPGEVFTLRTASRRSGVSPKVVQKEIRILLELGVLVKGKFTITLMSGKKVAASKQREPSWQFNADFRHASAISRFVHEVSPVHYKTIVGTLQRSGRIAAIILTGSFMGDPTRPADLVLAADGYNESRIEQAIRKLEPQFGREIRYALFSTPEFRYRLTIQDRLIRDTLDFPHLVLLDKTRLL